MSDDEAIIAEMKGRPVLAVACFCRTPPEDGVHIPSIGDICTAIRLPSSGGDLRMYFTVLVASTLPRKIQLLVNVVGPWSHNDTAVRMDVDVTAERGHQAHATATLDLPRDRPGIYWATVGLVGPAAVAVEVVVPLVALPPL
jgi:hypothetical protein